MTRWKASGIHLLICGLIALTVLAVMLFVWYPQPYFEALGGKRLLMILLGVDLTLGPLITLIIYNEQKKNLKYDLGIIAFIQLAALFYGASVLFEARPVYLVFTIDRFEVVSASDMDPEELKKVTDEKFKYLSFTGPKLAAAIMPENTEERQRILFSALDGGPDLQGMPQHYVAYSESTEDVLNRIKPLDDLPEFRSAFKTKIVLNAEKKGYDESSIGYLPVNAGNKFITAIMNLENAELIELVDTDPWG